MANHSSSRPSAIPLLNDLPKEDPQLGYDDYAETLASIIRGDDGRDDGDVLDNTPLTIGLFAPWGSGKSTLLNSLRRKVEETSPQSIVIDFNAWHHERSANLDYELINAMCQGVQETLNQEEIGKSGGAPMTEKAKTGLKYVVNLLSGLAETLVDNTEVSIGGKGPVKTSFRVSELKDVVKERNEDDDGAIGATRRRVEELQRTLPFNEDSFSVSQALDLLAQCLDVAGKRLVVLIDDLDRCAPDGITHSIETISSLTGRAGMIFVLALDRSYVVKALETHYHAQNSVINGTRYLEKIIQLPFTIPLPEFSGEGGTQMTIENLVGAENWGRIRGVWLDEKLQDDVRTIALEAMQSNPRQTKRFINTFLLLSNMFWDRLHGGNDDISQRNFLYMLGLQVSWPALYARIAQYINTSGEGDGESTALAQLEMVQNIVAAGDSESGQGQSEASSQAGGRGETVEGDFSDVIDPNEYRYVQQYLSNAVFSEMTLKEVKEIMQINPFAVDATISGSGPRDVLGRDFSKWNWTEEGRTFERMSKWNTLKLIAHRFREENPDCDKREFERRLGREIRLATSEKPSSQFKASRLLAVATDDRDDLDAYAIHFDGDPNDYIFGWSCGYQPSQSAIGKQLQRPIIEYFRRKGYPIERAE